VLSRAITGHSSFGADSIFLARATRSMAPLHARDQKTGCPAGHCEFNAKDAKRPRAGRRMGIALSLPRRR
jgi:hypothetical protein